MTLLFVATLVLSAVAVILSIDAALIGRSTDHRRQRHPPDRLDRLVRRINRLEP
jgi:hypothetical protein